eukprot:Pgem_evm1s8204
MTNYEDINDKQVVELDYLPNYDDELEDNYNEYEFEYEYDSSEYESDSRRSYMVTAAVVTTTSELPIITSSIFKNDNSNKNNINNNNNNNYQVHVRKDSFSVFSNLNRISTSSISPNYDCRRGSNLSLKQKILMMDNRRRTLGNGCIRGHVGSFNSYDSDSIIIDDDYNNEEINSTRRRTYAIGHNYKS